MTAMMKVRCYSSMTSKQQKKDWRESKQRWRDRVREEGGIPYFNERARHANKRVYTQYGITDKVTGEELYLLYQLTKSCDECGIDLQPKEVEFDHKTALKNGGEHTITNISIKCVKCNKRKGVK